MSYQPKWPDEAPAELRSEVVVNALGAVEARRLATLMADAETRARARLEAAKTEVEAIFAQARADAEALLYMLPDFAALDAAAPAKRGRSAVGAIRAVADRYGVAMAAVTGHSPNPAAKAARHEAVAAVIEACPALTDAQVASLFKLIRAEKVRDIRRQVGASRLDGGDVK